MRIISVLLLIASSIFSAYSQNDGVLIDPSETLTREPSATLQVGPLQSNMANDYGGFLVPRMTLANRSNIGSPATGLLIYQTDNTPGYYYYDGTTWTRLFEGTGNNNVIGSGTQNYLAKWNNAGGTTIGNSLVFDNGTNVGINETTPDAKLHVHAGALGTSAGNTIGMAEFDFGSSNNDQLIVEARRQSAGSDWNSAAHRLKRKVDVTDMGYIQFGSFNSDLITFGENATEYMRLDGNGNLGIGDAGPSAKLNVNTSDNGSDYPSTASFGDMDLFLERNNQGIEIGQAGAVNARRAWILARHNGLPTYGQFYQSLHLQPALNDMSQYRGIAIGYDASTAIPVNTFLAVSGNTGIGTLSPSAKLEVNLANPNGWSGNLKALRVNSPDNGYQMDLETYVVAGGNVGYHFKPNGNTGMVVTTPGNVGVGTTDPGYKLDVNGNTRVAGGLYTQGTASTLYGTNASIYANNANVSGGGIMISDDGGFFDYNNGPVTFNGSTGLVIAGSNGASSSNGYLRINQLAGTGTRDVYADANGQLVIKQVNSNIATYEQRSAVYMDNSNSGYRVVGGSTNNLAVQTGDKVIIMITHKFWWTGGSGGDHERYGLRVTGACGTLNYYESYKNGTSDDVPRNQEQSLAHQFIWTATCNGNVQFSLLCDNNSGADDNSYLGDIVVVATRQ